MKSNDKVTNRLSETKYSFLRYCFVAAFILSLQLDSFSQSTNSVKTQYPNIVKYSISSYALYPNSFHLGYERVLSRNKSIYVFGPKLPSQLIRPPTISGFNFF